MIINGLECFVHEPRDYTTSILMVNGFNGSMDSDHRIRRANAFAENGFRVLRWDYRSRTSDKPTKTLTEDLTDALSLVDYLGECGVYGDSWGGQIALQLGARSELVNTIVGRVPVTDLSYFRNHKETRENPCAPDFFKDMAEYDTYEDVLRRPVPTLIFSGTRDESCPLEYHEKLFALLPEPKKHVVFEQPHDWGDDKKADAETTREALAWFRQYLGKKLLRSSSDNPLA